MIYLNQLESNYSFYVNPKLARKAIYNDLTNSGATLRDQATDAIAISELLLFEFGFQGEKYYTDVVMKFNEGESLEEMSTKIYDMGEKLARNTDIGANIESKVILSYDS